MTLENRLQAFDDTRRGLLDEMEGRLRSTPLAWQPGARDLVSECRSLGVPTALVSASWSRLPWS